MPYCPKCKYEYTHGRVYCPDCFELLVESLPPEAESRPPTNWVPLQPLPGLIYAEMVKEVLERKGIPCILQSDVLSSAYGARGANLPGMQARILVPEEQAEKAREILYQMMDHI